ncbi:UNVERIFIED_CONTAM: hypothetical protein HHA_261960 [Hammondia hammondi]|eukprot:XP_008882902.1 hypothetical protein HHA_261960 [Hammondia hammondi]
MASVGAESDSCTATAPVCSDTSRLFLSLAAPPPSSFSRLNIDREAVDAVRAVSASRPAKRICPENRLSQDCLVALSPPSSPPPSLSPCPSVSFPKSIHRASSMPAAAPPVSRYLQQLHPSLLPPQFRGHVVHALEHEAAAKQACREEETPSSSSVSSASSSSSSSSVSSASSSSSSSSVSSASSSSSSSSVSSASSSSSSSSASALCATPVYHLPTQTACVSPQLLPSASLFLVGFLQHLRRQRREHQEKQRQLLLESLLHAGRFLSSPTPALRGLYEAKPHLCFTCSRRFATSARKTTHLRMHLDLQQLAQTEDASVFSRRRGFAARQRVSTAAASRPLWGGLAAWVQVAAASDVFQRMRLLQSRLALGGLSGSPGVHTPHGGRDETLSSVRAFFAERVEELRGFAASEAQQARGDGAESEAEEARDFPSWFPRLLQSWLADEWDVACRDECAPGAEREGAGEGGEQKGGREEAREGSGGDLGGLAQGEEREEMECENEPEGDPWEERPLMTKTEVRTWAWAFEDENALERESAAREICSLAFAQTDPRGVRTPRGSEAEPDSRLAVDGREGDSGRSPSFPGAQSVGAALAPGCELPRLERAAAERPSASAADVVAGVRTPGGALCPLARASQRTLLRQLTREVFLHLGSLSPSFEAGSSACSLASSSSSFSLRPLSQDAEAAATVAASEDPPRLLLDSASAPLSSCAFCGEAFSIVFNELQQTLLLQEAVAVAWEATEVLNSLARQLSGLPSTRAHAVSAERGCEVTTRCGDDSSASKTVGFCKGDDVSSRSPDAPQKEENEAEGGGRPQGTCGSETRVEEDMKREETECMRAFSPARPATSQAPSAGETNAPRASAVASSDPRCHSSRIPMRFDTDTPLTPPPAALLLPHLTRSSCATDAFSLRALQTSSPCEQLCSRWSLQPSVFSVAETVEAMAANSSRETRDESGGRGLSAHRGGEQQSLEEAVALLESAVAAGDLLVLADAAAPCDSIVDEEEEEKTKAIGRDSPGLAAGLHAGEETRQGEANKKPLDAFLEACASKKSEFPREMCGAGKTPISSTEEAEPEKTKQEKNEEEETRDFDFTTSETVEDLFPPNVVYLHCSCFTQLLRESEELLHLVRLLLLLSREHRKEGVSSVSACASPAASSLVARGDRDVDRTRARLSETFAKAAAFHRLLRPAQSFRGDRDRVWHVPVAAKRERDGGACKGVSEKLQESHTRPLSPCMHRSKGRARGRLHRRRRFI